MADGGRTALGLVEYFSKATFLQKVRADIGTRPALRALVARCTIYSVRTKSLRKTQPKE